MGTGVASLFQIGNMNEIKPGEMKSVFVQGRDILLAHVGDAYYAADNRCPHMGGNLLLGKLAGTIVACPRHQSQFYLQDGRVVRWTTWPAALVAGDQVRSRKRPLQVYPVTLEAEKIMMRL
jgi:3-phenylpropionate/trans-cinnamate dioxygenase ferredoxin component